jgi:hypothetical protein
MTQPNIGKILVASAAMLPRQVLPRQFYLVTRRCTQRQFLLRPDPETNNAFTYALIEAAQRAEIDGLLPCAMSNHYHAVISISTVAAPPIRLACVAGSCPAAGCSARSLASIADRLRPLPMCWHGADTALRLFGMTSGFDRNG